MHIWNHFISVYLLYNEFLNMSETSVNTVIDKFPLFWLFVIRIVHHTASW